MIRASLHTDQHWNFGRSITTRSDCKIRMLDSDMYAYLTKGHLGLPPERKSWLFTPIYREIVKRRQKRRLQGAVSASRGSFQRTADTASGYFTLFSGSRAKRPRVVLTIICITRVTRLLRIGRISGCHSLVHVVQLHREIISARQDQLKDGIGKTICQSYFLVSIGNRSFLG
jgi:hypothetical protein